MTESLKITIQCYIYSPNECLYETGLMTFAYNRQKLSNYRSSEQLWNEMFGET